MIRALNSAATGMEAQQTYIDVTSNNLANVNTTGFKKSRANFEDLMYETQRAAGTSTSAGTVLPSGIQVGLGSKTSSTQRSFTGGAIKMTDRPLDMAIEGDGFFQIALPGGTTGYTRAGNFHLSPEGLLVTSQGYPLEPQIEVPPNATELSVGDDGTVTAVIDGQEEPAQLGQIQLANFVNPAGLRAMGGNLFAASGASGPPIVGNPGEDGRGALLQGSLEASNVRVVEEMVNLITGQRAFEFNSKAVQAADQMLRELGNLR